MGDHHSAAAVSDHFLVQAFVIPTGSMEDTLLIGDHLLVDKLAFAPAGPVFPYYAETG